VVSEQLEESLRAEVENYVERRMSAVRKEIAEIQHQLNEALTRLQEEKGDGQWDGSLASAISEHLRGAHERGVEMAAAASARAQASADMAIIKASIEEIEGHRSQGEVLKTLVNRASCFAPRTAFFVIKGDEARGWRARGFQGSVGDEAIKQIMLSLSNDTVISEAVASGTTWSGTANSHADDHKLLDQLGEQLPQRVVAVPLVVRKRTVAVMYADSAGLDSEAINLEAVETLVRVAGMAVELLSVAQAAAARTPEPTRVEPGKSSEAGSRYEPTREYEPPASSAPLWHKPEPAVEAMTPVAEPIVETTTDYGSVFAEPQATPRVDAFSSADPLSYAESTVAAKPVIEPEPFSEPAPYAEEIEPVATPETSFADLSSDEVEPAATDSVTTSFESESSPLTSRRRYGYDSSLPVEVTDEEERRQHNDARRFARLLVSEIKLYNEQKVIEGRSQRDLYDRLREYIDRSREMYDKRVKPVVSERYDYFHHELINTLAEGDAAKLGSAYPGTTVSA